jgi:hypothetical protein
MPDVGESVRTDKENAFTEAQIIKKNQTRLLELYKPLNTVNTGAELQFELDDSGSTKTEYATIKGEILTNTDTLEDGVVRIYAMKAGVKTNLGSFRGDDSTVRLGPNNRISLSETGLTGVRTFTFPDQTAVMAGQNFVNVFTEIQKIQKDSQTLLTLYRPVNTVGGNSNSAVWFNAQNSTPSETQYAAIQGEISTNTAGAETGVMRLVTRIAGTAATRAKIEADGSFSCGGANARINLIETGLTAGRVYTFPDSNQLVTGTTAAQTLTNKTMDARSNTVPNIAVNPIDKRWGCFQPSTGTTATSIGQLDGLLGQHVATGAGTNTVTFDTTEGMICNFVATATANLNIGLVAANATNPTCRRLFGCKMSARVKIDSTTSARMYVGFAAAALAISDTPIASGVDGVLVGFTSAATNFEIYSNDNSGTMTTTAITGPIAKNSNWHTIEINWTASGNVDVVFDGVTQTLSANIPLTTTNLFFNCVGQTTTTTARTFSIHSVWIECDK